MRPEHPVALITGASSGIGAACARTLAQAGCHLVLGARRKERVETLASELFREFGARVHTGFLDTRDTASVDSLVAAGAEALGGLHVVVANAGGAWGVDKLDSVLEEDWQSMLHTNVEGVIRTLKAALPFVRKSGWGHFFTIGSTASHVVYEGGGAYCASKHAVKALTQTLRLELCGEPIRVTEVDPGMVETEFSLVRLKDEAKAKRVYQGIEALSGQDVAECIRWALALPDHVNIDEIVVKCRDQASHTTARVHRRA
jgi:hypothetical protein